MEPLLTTDEVAVWLRVEVVTVRRLIGRGDLPAYRIGNEYRFKENDLDVFLARQRINEGAVGEGLNTARGERFTKRAYAALGLAHEEATRCGRHYVDVEDMLLSMTHDEESVAALALGALGITLVDVRRAVEHELTQDNAAPAPLDRATVDAVEVALHRLSERGADAALEMDLTARAHKALQLATDEAMRFGRPQVGTGQLLLGLIRADTGALARALHTLGVPLDEARARTTQILRAEQTTDD